MAEARTRQLAAIMFADMVGYTALMQEDENNARAQRDRHREILSAAVARYHGKVLQYYGDGTLSIFASAVEAVECAVEVQMTVTREPLIPLRIGVHTGDIVHDADGVYGDGVNVASRIEGLSAPGGVMVSGKVFDEIKNHPSISATPMGAVRLKNVEFRISVFAIANEGLSVPSPADVRARAEGAGARSFTPASELTGEDGTPLPPGPVGIGEAFLQRVRDRAIIPWSLIYLAGAFIVVQAVGFVGARLGWSPLIRATLTPIAFVGFLVTLVVAWYHGEKGRQRVQRTEVVLIALLLLLGGATLRFLPSGDPAASAGPPRVGPLPVVADDRPSVAALPWDNRSGMSEDRYFTDGIHDEILTRLSKISGLRVISRQSVMQFRDSPLTARQIAAELGVEYIVQAGLLRVRDTVRLNVQLINARTDEVAWAATHDRYLTMENLLSIQTEIAQAIADSMRATVTPAEQAELGRHETDNLEAYEFYLQGRSYYLRPGYDREDFEAAIALYERAIDLDPEFALAHAALSRVHGLMYWERFDPSPQRLEAQRAEALEAMRLQEDLPQAHLAIGWANYVVGDFEQALEHYMDAREGLPNDAEIVALIGYTHRRLGNWPEVFSAYEEATRLNPRDATLFYDLGGHSFAVRRRYPEAVQAYDRALSLAPTLRDAALLKGEIYVHWQGQLDTLRAVVAALPRDVHTAEVDIARLDLALLERDADRVLRLLESELEDVFETQLVYLPRSLYAGWAYRLRGDSSAARTAFESARLLLDSMARERPDDERVHAALGFAYAGLGRSDEAASSARRTVQVSPRTANAISRSQVIEASAKILAQAGLADQAVTQLRQLLAANSPVSVHTLRLDPIYDPIRESPLFQALLEN